MSENAASRPEQPNEEMSRMVGDQVMRVIEIPAEDPMAIKERDGVHDETIGSKPMTSYGLGGPSPSDYGDMPKGYTTGRKAPKYVGETPGWHK